MGPRVVVTDSVFPTLDPARQVLAQVGAELVVAERPEPAAVAELARDAEAVMVTYMPITAELIRQLPRCRIIARFGIGVDNVDVAAATQAGIVVTNVPDYCIDEVSDHALALLLALARRLLPADRAVRAGVWSVSALTPIHRLRGRVLGLVGFGKIARALARKAQALGLEVLAYDPYLPPEAIEAQGARPVGFQELLERSDFISIHAPLTPETRHLFNEEAFGKIKPGAFLINTARGPIVDERALLRALESGRLAGAALDVLEQEPPPADAPLLRREDVLITPHIAFYSEESLVELQTKAAEEVVRVLQGQVPRNPVNPEVLSSLQPQSRR
jgi:D-3-phosphoglycerate dehydrogenase